MSVSQVGALTVFTTGANSVSDLNADLSAIRTQFNNLVTATDTLEGGLTIGSATFSGAVTISTGGLTVTAGGIFITAGNLSLGSALQARIGVFVSSGVSLSGNVAQYGIYSQPTGGSDATTSLTGIYSSPITAAATFTCTSLYGVYIATGSLGAGSTVTTQYGLYIANQALGGTNYGIYTNTGPNSFGDAVTIRTGGLTVTAGGITITAGALTANGGLTTKIGGSTSTSKPTLTPYLAGGLSTTATVQASITSYSLPAGALAATGDTVRVTVTYSYNAAFGAGFTLQPRFGATNLATYGAIAIASAEQGVLVFYVTRTGATAQLALVSGIAKNAAGTTAIHTDRTAPAETLSGAILIDIQGKVGNTGDTLFIDSVIGEVVTA